jgi:hypothetical protein
MSEEYAVLLDVAPDEDEDLDDVDDDIFTPKAFVVSGGLLLLSLKAEGLRRGPKPPGPGWTIDHEGPRGGKYWAPPRKKPKASQKPAPKGKQGLKPTVNSILQHVADVLTAGKSTPRKVKQLGDMLFKMTVKDINALKQKVGVKASGAKRDMAQKVAERIMALDPKAVHARHKSAAPAYNRSPEKAQEIANAAWLRYLEAKEPIKERQNAGDRISDQELNAPWSAYRDELDKHGIISTLGGYQFKEQAPKQPRSKRPAKLSTIIRKHGGLSEELARKIGLPVDQLKEDMPGIFKDSRGRKGKMGADVLVNSLISEGYMPKLRDNETEAEALTRALEAGAHGMLEDIDRQLAREQEAYHKELEDVRKAAERNGLSDDESRRAIDQAEAEGRKHGEIEGRAKSPDEVHADIEDSAAREPEPPDARFTGSTTDSLGREYHWVDGKRVATAAEVSSAQFAKRVAEDNRIKNSARLGTEWMGGGDQSKPAKEKPPGYTSADEAAKQKFYKKNPEVGLVDAPGVPPNVRETFSDETASEADRIHAMSEIEFNLNQLAQEGRKVDSLSKLDEDFQQWQADPTPKAAGIVRTSLHKAVTDAAMAHYYLKADPAKAQYTEDFKKVLGHVSAYLDKVLKSEPFKSAKPEWRSARKDAPATRGRKHGETEGGAKSPGEVHSDLEKASAREPQPPKERFTGNSSDALGHEYHWVDGKRVATAAEVAKAKFAKKVQKDRRRNSYLRHPWKDRRQTRRKGLDDGDTITRKSSEYHGPNAPGPGWTMVGTGPRGGKIWRPGANAQQHSPEQLRRGIGAHKPAATTEKEYKGDGTKQNPARCGSNIELAARLLSEGKYIRLKQPDQVSTLTDKMAEMINAAVQHGEAAPDFDLCKISVKGTNLFCQDNLGIPRVKMPQMRGKPIPGSLAAMLPAGKKSGKVDLTSQFILHLQKHGIESEETAIRASHLRASQNQIVGSRVVQLVNEANAGERDLREKPIFVTRDNYVVDGHHHWAAIVAYGYANDKDLKIPVYRLNMEIGEALQVANDFTKAYGLAPKSGDAPSPRQKIAEAAGMAGAQKKTTESNGVLTLKGAQYHGPNPPGPGWHMVGQGPKGGKIWEPGKKQQKPEAEAAANPADKEASQLAIAFGQTAESFIKHAAKQAKEDWIQDRIERVKIKMHNHDERWSKTVKKIARIYSGIHRADEAHLLEVEKLSKMIEGDPPATTQECIAQGEKTDLSLQKYFRLKKTANDRAWKVMKKAAATDFSYMDPRYVIKKVKLNRDGLDTQQNKDVDAVERRLSGLLTDRLQSQVDQSVVHSIPADKKQRAYFSWPEHGHGALYVEQKTNAGTVIHELGHSLETHHAVFIAAEGFLYSRVKDEPAKPLGQGYDPYEVGRDDDFAKAFGSHARYVGKHYKHAATEITSMGLEMMYNDAAGFATKDPEYFKFILGVLDGTFAV